MSYTTLFKILYRKNETPNSKSSRLKLKYKSAKTDSEVDSLNLYNGNLIKNYLHDGLISRHEDPRNEESDLKTKLLVFQRKMNRNGAFDLSKTLTELDKILSEYNWQPVN